MSPFIIGHNCPLSAGSPFVCSVEHVRDLLLRAKHLFVAAMVAGCGMTWLNEGWRQDAVHVAPPFAALFTQKLSRRCILSPDRTVWTSFSGSEFLWLEREITVVGSALKTLNAPPANNVDAM
jgi:hypothetical protein